jgi:anti-anti-sigma regulatory factor
VLVSSGAINGLDASGIEMLAALVDGLRKKDIAVVFSGVKPNVRAVLDRTGMSERIAAENFFSDESEALAALSGRLAAGARA